MVSFRNSTDSYGTVALALHWIVAALVFAQLAIGVYAANLPISLARLQWLARHKSLGLAILVLVLLRLAWRALNAPPALPHAMPQWERRAAHATHWAIYVLLVLAPLAGWLYASAAGLSVNWFGLFQVPDLVGKDRALAAVFKALHIGLVALLALLLVLHIGAALRHALVLRDGIAHRMLPWKPRPPRAPHVLLLAFAVTLVVTLIAAPARAEECYSVEPAKSSVAFEVKQAGAPFRGTFRRFGGTLCLAQERVVRIDVWLEPASVTTDLPEIDAAMKDKEFFDVAAHPRITFTSSGAATRGDKEVAQGTLAIKSKRRQVEVPIQLRSGAAPSVSGSISLNRLDYDIGIGEWSDTRWLAADVTIEFKATLARP
jgi:cytochrome b561